MAFLRNAWYPASWTSDVTSQLVHRVFLNDPVLLYRDSQGVAHAVGNRCPHRFAPLHMGRLVNDVIECGYHGLQFNAEGSCVHNPHDQKTSDRARIPAYPLIERDSMLWIWMGASNRADPSTIPDLSERLSSNRFRAVCGSMKMDANYELLMDNLLDHSHGQYLHANALKFDGFFSVPYHVEQTDTTVVGARRYSSVAAMPSLIKYMPDHTGPVDAWSEGKWLLPSLCLQDVGIAVPGAPERTVRRCGIHLLTPETENSTHYLFAAVRNYGLDDTAMDADSHRWFEEAFNQQDRPMVEAVQHMMNGRSLEDMHPVLVSSDGAAMRARKILRDLIRGENDARTMATA